MTEQLPPHRHGGGPAQPDGRADRSGGRRRGLRRFVVGGLVLAVLAFGAGALFGRADPQRAARLVVAEFTVTEDGPPDAPGPDPRTPVTGPQRGAPVCGRQDAPLDPARQVATLAAGVVLVQHGEVLTADEGAIVDRLAERDRVATAPAPALPPGTAVVATSWRHRMALERYDADLLDAFVTGHADRAPAGRACP